MTELLFILKKVVTALVLPPAGPLLLAVFGLACVRRWPRLGRVCTWSGVLGLLVLSLPLTAQLLARALLLDSSATQRDWGQAQAVVILGGGTRYAPEYGGLTISEAALERVRYGAKLARERQLPILVTGGVVFEGAPEGDLMASALRDSFRTEPRWIERRSRDTHGNAVYSAEILHAAGIRTVLLVTHDFHERRSLAEFTAVGIDAIPVGVTTTGPLILSVSSFAPGVGALDLTMQSLHEILGILVLSP